MLVSWERLADLLQVMYATCCFHLGINLASLALALGRHTMQEELNTPSDRDQESRKQEAIATFLSIFLFIVIFAGWLYKNQQAVGDINESLIITTAFYIITFVIAL